MAPPRPSDDRDEADQGELGAGRDRRLAMAVLAVVVAAGVVLRFLARSPLWLDEALSVDIARLPIGEIPGALRHDGHPPLYYVLLHAWMAVFGDGDTAVRALSGVASLAVFPLLWCAGRRLGGRRVAWGAVLLLAISPYAIRYGTETRMYALMMVFGLAGWLLLDDALDRPTIPRLAGLAGVVAAMLWTHYWGLWVVVVAGGAMVVQAAQAHRRDEPAARSARIRILVALAVGGAAFLPWMPTLLYQSAHTGTPWARPMRPTEIVTATVADLGGGPKPEAVLLGWLVVVLALVGALGRRTPQGTVEIEGSLHEDARPFALAVAGTLGLACVVGYATGATYVTRYASVVIPFVLLLAAVGLAVLPRRAAAIAVVLVVGLGVIGAYRNATVDRTDAQRSADAIEARGHRGDLVVFCPDQLGPSTARVLARGFDEVTFASFGPADRVDWVDYQARLDAANVDEFASQALERAGSHQVFLVYSTAYETHEEICPALFNALGATRPPEVLTQPTEAYEPSSVVLFAPPAR